MRLRHKRISNSRRERSDTRPNGFTFIEVLVSIVLLGTAGIATMVALRTTVVGTRIERDHSRAQQWLQSAVGALEATGRLDCDVVLAGYTTGEETVRGEYQKEIRLALQNPPGWNDSQITVVQPIKVWDGARYWDPYDPLAPAPCFDDLGYELQLVTMQVTSPDGAIIETVQVVKTSD
jgi:prepilin-type N-terminal cleavage/methylation domain-containing protein